VRAESGWRAVIVIVSSSGEGSEVLGTARSPKQLQNYHLRTGGGSATPPRAPGLDLSVGCGLRNLVA
jgi:hypothetical protein